MASLSFILLLGVASVFLNTIEVNGRECLVWKDEEPSLRSGLKDLGDYSKESDRPVIKPSYLKIKSAADDDGFEAESGRRTTRHRRRTTLSDDTGVCSAGHFVPKFVKCYANKVANKSFYDNPENHQVFMKLVLEGEMDKLMNHISEKNHVPANRENMVKIMNCFLKVIKHEKY